jgi:hypothetical protein
MPIADDKLRENVTAPRGMYMHRAIRKKRYG